MVSCCFSNKGVSKIYWKRGRSKQQRGRDFFDHRKSRGAHFFGKKITGRILFFEKKNHGAHAFFRKENHGAHTFFAKKITGCKTFSSNFDCLDNKTLTRYFISNNEITGCTLFFAKKITGRQLFCKKKITGHAIFFQKNHGAQTFWEQKNHGAKTFFAPNFIYLIDPVSAKFCSLPKILWLWICWYVIIAWNIFVVVKLLYLFHFSPGPKNWLTCYRSPGGSTMETCSGQGVKICNSPSLWYRFVVCQSTSLKIHNLWNQIHQGVADLWKMKLGT